MIAPTCDHPVQGRSVLRFCKRRAVVEYVAFGRTPGNRSTRVTLRYCRAHADGRFAPLPWERESTREITATCPTNGKRYWEEVEGGTPVGTRPLCGCANVRGGHAAGCTTKGE